MALPEPWSWSRLWSRLPKFSKRALLGGVILLGLGTALGFTTPRATVGESTRGLVQIAPSGLASSITRVTFHYGSQKVALRLEAGQWVPVHRVPAGIWGTVQIHLAGPKIVSWLPFFGHRLRTEKIITPAVPAITHTARARSLAGGVAVTFAHPAVQVRYRWEGQVRIRTWKIPTTKATLLLPPTPPGHTGTLVIQARARTWEPLSTVHILPWTTAPYLSVTASPATTIAPTAALTVTFSQPVPSPDWSHWVMSPATAGHWKSLSPTTYQFTPSTTFGFGPNATIQLVIPGGSNGVHAQGGSYLAQSTSLEWTTTPGSTLRLQQLLAEEGYLPVSWTAAQPGSRSSLALELATVDNPPVGTFHWKYPNLPSALKALWTPGQWSVVTQGALMQFQRVNGLPVNGEISPSVWLALLHDRIHGKMSPDGYTYISVTENQPETLELWVNGQLSLTTLTNTGIPQTPTALGTYPIYERLLFQVMQGFNPNGVPYADPVHWINYFSGGDAVHGFYRAAYGFPQSLGCVEMPLNVASTVYHAVHYGTLVTVNPPGIAPAKATAS